MKIQWNRVTWYSKLLAVVVFLITFAIAFELGMMYQAQQGPDDEMDMQGMDMGSN